MSALYVERFIFLLLLLLVLAFMLYGLLAEKR